MINHFCAINMDESLRGGAGCLTEGKQVTIDEALCLRDLGDMTKAIALLENLVARQPQHFESLRLLGLLSAQLGRMDQAVEWICRAIEVEPQSATALIDLGRFMCSLGHTLGGGECFDKAALFCFDSESCFSLGSAFYEIGQWQKAFEHFERAIALKSDFVFAYNNRGLALGKLGLLDLALESFDKAIALEPKNAVLHNNRGVAFYDLDHDNLAVQSYDKAIALQPNYAVAYSNRGNALCRQMQLADAIASYDHSIALDPWYAEAYWNKSLTLLQIGHYKRGWALHEWRWKRPAFQTIKRDFSQPLWLGNETVHGKTLLLHSEQGLGDTIQFCRYAPLATALGATVILEVEHALAGLLKCLEGVSQLVVKGCSLPTFDYHCPLLSLPLAFQTDLTTVPSAARYLVADPAKLAHWSEKLGKRTMPRIGLVWSGDPTHRNDKHRSLGLSQLLEYLPDEYQYVSLQKELRQVDAAALRLRPDVLHFGDQLADFSDTAALCELMDLIISVDTSVAHLSGALGRPTLLLLPYCPDWRWLLDRDDSPWYGSFTLLRQQRVGDWAGVLGQLDAAIARHMPIAQPQASTIGGVERDGHAVDLLCRAIEVNPSSDSAFYYLGFAMCKLKQFAAGVECFDKALVLNPRHAQAACDRASALVELGQFEAALAGYDYAIALRADYAEAYSYRGNALLALQRTDEAIASVVFDS